MLRYLSLLLLFGTSLLVNAQLVITEIMYNPPESGTDSLEYIEIYNAGSGSIDLTGYTLTLSSNSSNPDMLSGTLNAGDFYVTAVNASAFQSVFGVAPSAETMFGGLRNGGDRTLTLAEANGNIVDEVTYQNAGDWPSEANGNGPSIELCDLAADNNEGSNWVASMTNTAVFINNVEVFGSPFLFSAVQCGSGGGPTTYPARSIGELIGIDGNGQLDSIGATAEITGIVNSPDFNGGTGTEFFIQDNSGGIRIAGDGSFYEPTVGDLVIIRGTVEQRNGIAQFAADSIGFVSPGNPVSSVVVTTIDEALQGQLVTLENVSVVDSTMWERSGSFNVEITDGINTYTLRIDADTDISGLNYPTGTFDVSGIATQFDSSSPFDEGYQLLPRFAADFSPYVPGAGLVYPLYDIAVLTTEDADGVADSLGVAARVEGTVIGVDLNGTGLLFTIVDDAGNGIAIYSPTEDFNYVAREGDRIAAEGEVTQFNGLTQLEIIDLDFQSSGNAVPAAAAVVRLGEETESRLVTLSEIRFVDPGQWRGNGSSFNVDAVLASGDTITIRIDDATELSTAMAPAENVFYNVTGIGGQFDRSEPYTSGYQLFPRFLSDLQESVGTRQVAPQQLLRAYSDGHSIVIDPVKTLREVVLLDVSGRVLAKADELSSRTYLSVPSRNSIVVLTARSSAGESAAMQVRH